MHLLFSVRSLLLGALPIVVLVHCRRVEDGAGIAAGKATARPLTDLVVRVGGPILSAFASFGRGEAAALRSPVAVASPVVVIATAASVVTGRLVVHPSASVRRLHASPRHIWVV